MIQSPFASHNIQQFIPVEHCNPELEKIKRFVLCKLNEHLKLEGSSSTLEEFRCKQKEHKYIENVGTLMVYHKKPFHVRFKM